MTYWSSSENNFDNYGRLTRSHAAVDPAGTPDDLVDLNYKYDDLGNPTWRYDALQNGSGGAPKWSQHYQYDRRSQLTKAVQGEMDGNWSESTPTMTSPDNTWVWHGEHEGETYSLDAMGNWAKSLNKAGQIDIRAHNTSNQITNRTLGGQQRTIAFDAAGNMTDNGSSYKCVYDFLNRLIEVTRQDDTTLAKYYYDGLNRRIRKIEYATDGTTEESDVHYLYDIDWRVIEERDENDSSALVARYIYGGMYIDDPVVMYRDHNSDDDFADANEVLYYLQDRLFNVVALTNVSGEVVERVVYEPYGRSTCRRASDNDETVYSHFGNPYLFTGHRLDSEYDNPTGSTCFYLARNRYYSAAMGRFISRDPIGYEGEDFNLYRYVFNNPLIYTDSGGYAAESESDSETEESVCEKFLAKLKDGTLKRRLLKDPNVKKSLQCNVNIYCSDDCGSGASGPLGGMAFRENGYVNICLNNTITDENKLEVFLIHETTHAAQYIADNPKLCKPDNPYEGDCPPLPPLIGEGEEDSDKRKILCQQCVKYERPAYKKSCRYKYPTKGLKRTRCINVGLYASCGHICDKMDDPNKK